MSRTLILMRHAAAEGFSAAGDKGRSLGTEGREEARAVGRDLSGLGVQHVLCSSATRTRQTVDELGLDAPVEYMDALYNCSSETIAQRITEIDAQVQVLLVVAHAPGIPGLAAELAYAQDHKAADDLQCWYPTGAFVRFELDGPWAGLLEDDSLRMIGVERPEA